MADGRARERRRAGSDIELALQGPAGDAKLAAYRAVPAAERGKGVLVVDGVGGLSDFARDVCDRLARSGFSALAAELSPGADAASGLDAAIRRLLDDHATDGPRIGVWGFGGDAVRLLAGGDAQRRIGCVVGCGGVPAPEAAEGSAEAAVPMLLLLGEQDDHVEDARRLADARDAYHLQLLPDVAGDFMDPARADRHDATATESAWDAAMVFFEASL